MHRERHRTFLGGLICGMGLALTVALLAAPAPSTEDADNMTSGPRYFVTGDTNNATLWQRNEDGSLECLSRNRCRMGSPDPRPLRDHR